MHREVSTEGEGRGKVGRGWGRDSVEFQPVNGGDAVDGVVLEGQGADPWRGTGQTRTWRWGTGGSERRRTKRTAKLIIIHNIYNI